MQLVLDLSIFVKSKSDMQFVRRELSSLRKDMTLPLVSVSSELRNVMTIALKLWR